MSGLSFLGLDSNASMVEINGEECLINLNDTMLNQSCKINNTSTDVVNDIMHQMVHNVETNFNASMDRRANQQNSQQFIQPISSSSNLLNSLVDKSVNFENESFDLSINSIVDTQTIKDETGSIFDDFDDEDEDCASYKRQMNESIMSIDDPNIVENKRLKSSFMNSSIDNIKGDVCNDFEQVNSPINENEIIEVILIYFFS